MKFGKTIRGKNNKNTIIIFPPWESLRVPYYFISKKLSKEYCVITYHYSSDILNSDTEDTLNNFITIVNDATECLNSLSKDNICILGLSIGSYLAFMFAKKNKISKLFVVTSSSSFSEFVWYGNATKRIKKEIVKQKFSLSKLDTKWKELSPSYRLDKIKAKLLLILSEADTIIPYKLGQDLVNKLNQNKVKHNVQTFKNSPHILVIFLKVLKIYLSGKYPDF